MSALTCEVCGGPGAVIDGYSLIADGEDLSQTSSTHSSKRFKRLQESLPRTSAPLASYYDLSDPFSPSPEHTPQIRVPDNRMSTGKLISHVPFTPRMKGSSGSLADKMMESVAVTPMVTRSRSIEGSSDPAKSPPIVENTKVANDSIPMAENPDGSCKRPQTSTRHNF